MSDTEESGTEAPAPKITKATKKQVAKFTKPLTGAAAAKPAPAKKGYQIGSAARKEVGKHRKEASGNRTEPPPVDLQTVATNPRAITQAAKKKIPAGKAVPSATKKTFVTKRKSIVKNVKKTPPTEEEEPGSAEPVDGITPGGVKRKHRWRPGTVAMREIKRYQKSTDNLIPKAAMERLIREVMADVAFRWSQNPEQTLRLGSKAREALQEAAEMYITEKLADMGVLAHEHKRVTIMPKHLKMLTMLNGMKKM